MKNMTLYLLTTLFIIFQQGFTSFSWAIASEENTNHDFVKHEITEVEAQLIAELTSAAQRLASLSQEKGSDPNALYWELDLPASQAPNLGLVIDINDPQGYRVLSVSPFSMAPG